MLHESSSYSFLSFLYFSSPRPKAVTPPYFSDGVVNKGLEGVSEDITKAGIYTTNTSGINGGMNGHIPSGSHPNPGEISSLHNKAN